MTRLTAFEFERMGRLVAEARIAELETAAQLRTLQQRVRAAAEARDGYWRELQAKYPALAGETAFTLQNDRTVVPSRPPGAPPAPPGAGPRAAVNAPRATRRLRR